MLNLSNFHRDVWKHDERRQAGADNRDATWQGPALEVSGVLDPSATYDVETWVRLPEARPTISSR